MAIPGLDARFISAVDLNPYFVDKNTGEPLAGGIVTFYEDLMRTTPKPVYQLTGAPPNYTYTALPNPLILSSVGTFQDAAGNDIAVYYFPYDAAGNQQLYYITVTDSIGNEQFTREAWPFPNGSGGMNVAGLQNIENQITNPQFVVINFANPLTITIAGAGITEIQIAPGWLLTITTTGASTVTVARNSISGVSALPSNPPYTLTITPGLNIASIFLTQVLPNTPDIWSPSVLGAQNGYVNASVLLAPNSTAHIIYEPSTGPGQTILNLTNTTGVFTEFNRTIQLAPATNPDNSTVGFVNIYILLSTTNPTTLGNIQIIGLSSNITSVVFDQETANRQIDHMFNYYNPQLQYKPIESFLVGWDFPFNPTQPLGPTVAAVASGANTSHYIWDQTIVFQSANSGAAASRSASGNGALRITATNTTQFALVQYLPQSVARKILNSPLSVNVSALTNQVAGITGTISLWYTANALLPSIGANNSIVMTLDANGYPTTQTGGVGDTWHEITRSGRNPLPVTPPSLLGNAQFIVETSATTNFNDYGFSGWNANGVAGVNTATFFAIVVGFGSLTAANYVEFDSISLIPGYIPTKSAPKTIDENLREASYYFQMSFEQGIVPANAVGTPTGNDGYPAQQAGVAVERSQSYGFKVPMITAPTMTIYSVTNGSGEFFNFQRNQNCSISSLNTISSKNFTATCMGSAGTQVSDDLMFHWTADSRLGL